MILIDPMELKRAISVSSILHDGKTLEQIIDEQPTVEPKTGRWIDKINRWLDPDIDSELALERIREIMYKMEDENDTDRHGDAD